LRAEPVLAATAAAAILMLLLRQLLLQLLQLRLQLPLLQPRVSSGFGWPLLQPPQARARIRGGSAALLLAHRFQFSLGAPHHDMRRCSSRGRYCLRIHRFKCKYRFLCGDGRWAPREGRVGCPPQESPSLQGCVLECIMCLVAGYQRT
jgi:hypothetical protein